MKSIPVFLCLLLTGCTAAAQSWFIKGKVINGETGSPVANASVFITNTSKGTISSTAGEFELNNVPVGNYDLVVSCIGFETQVYSYKPAQLPLHIQVQLKPKAEELEAVVVEPFEKDGWEKWGKFFTDNFLGTSADAARCTLKNHEVLRFRHSRKTNRLSVVATEPLIIENRPLGYQIRYQLEEFSFDFNEHMLLYYGYTLFTDLKNRPPSKKQLAGREKAYNGSMAHFMKSLYDNRLQEKGFEVKRLLKKPNTERQRVKKLYAANLSASLPADSSAYYSKVLRQPEMLETYLPGLLSADSLLQPVDARTKQLFFTDYLYITYKKALEEKAYVDYTRENRHPFYQRSVVFLLNNHPLLIDQMGNYYMPQDCMSYGYWGWSEKVSKMLPRDYKE